MSIYVTCVVDKKRDIDMVWLQSLTAWWMLQTAAA